MNALTRRGLFGFVGAGVTAAIAASFGVFGRKIPWLNKFPVLMEGRRYKTVQAALKHVPPEGTTIYVEPSELAWSDLTDYDPAWFDPNRYHTITGPTPGGNLMSHDDAHQLTFYSKVAT